MVANTHIGIRNVTLILFLFLQGTTAKTQIIDVSRTQNNIDNKENLKTSADYYWDTMPRISYNYTHSENGKSNYFKSFSVGPRYPEESDSIVISSSFLIDKQAYYIYNEMYRRMLRDWGIEFWKRYPNDPRRFKWLIATCIYEPSYFANIREGVVAQLENRYITPLDVTAKKEWDQLYSRYLKEVQCSNQLEEEDKEQILAQQLNNIYGKRWRNSEKDKFNVDKYAREVIAFVNLYGDKSISTRSLRRVQDFKSNFGLTNEDVKRYISWLRSVKVVKLEETASFMEKLIRLEEMAFHFQAQSTKGERINLKQYGGKLVLVDFWSITCSSCIKQMPEIRSVYEKYKDMGFSVISACLWYGGKYQKDERNRIEAVHNRTGADWPLVLLNNNKGGAGRKIFDHYGFQGVPQMLLLDGEGKLLHYNNDLRNKGGLERILELHFEKTRRDTGRIMQQASRKSPKKFTTLPDFRFTSQTGVNCSIFDIVSKHKYTLIDFWASWCSPCRAAVPELKKAYEAFNKKGFNVIGISTDKDIAKWKLALKEDQTPWKHGLDNVDMAVKNIFKLMAIPGYLLVDQNGRIVQSSMISVIGINNQIQAIPGKNLSHDLYDILKRLFEQIERNR